MIVLRDLTKSYSVRGRRKVVADRINAVVPSGISLALLGRNGAGKSTLLRMIAGTADGWIDLISCRVRRIVPPGHDRRAKHTIRGTNLWRKFRCAAGIC